MTGRAMLKERGLRRLRRVCTVGGVFLAFALGLIAAPVWVPGLVVLDGIRRSRASALRFGAYMIWLLGCEVVGLCWAAALRIRPTRTREIWLDRHYNLQHRWASWLFSGGVRLFGLRLRVQGGDALRRGPVLLFMRHATVVDALLPAVLASRPHGIRLRYVLKQELRIDPCLDIVGDRLPNAFVRRGLPDGSGELARVVALTQGLGPRDGIVIYPEGTRFTEATRARLLRRLADRGDLERLEVARSFRRVLPPRLGGVMGLLDAAPDTDVVFCAHTGLEQVTRLGDLISGRALGARLEVSCWRVPAAEIPVEEAARQSWLEQNWRRVDQFAVQNQVGKSTGEAPRGD